MSLLYECIHGIIQGGIFGGAEGFNERDEIAGLCVSKLRGMIVVEGDPNCKSCTIQVSRRLISPSEVCCTASF